MGNFARLALLLIGLSASPAPAQGPPGPPPRPDRPGGDYSLEQATSDQAQLHTIAFSGLAFLTGDPGASSFIPPGKVADFFGFQYMRDIDAAGMGHNPMFLDRISAAVTVLLDPAQRQAFARAAREEAVMLEAIARRRLPLVAAFHRQLDGNLPAGCAGLDRAAVESCTADLFEEDARLAWHRARAFGDLAASLSPAQKHTLASWKFGDFRSWPQTDPETFRELRPRGASRLESVAFMTLGSEFFSWVAGGVEADTYFCPERHGTCFGGFYLKDLPAMGQRDCNISTRLTGDTGEAFLQALTLAQRASLTAVVEQQRPDLQGIIRVRRRMATLLRGFLAGNPPSEAEARALGRVYGQLDGHLSYLYATAFTAIQRSAGPAQQARFKLLRGLPSQEKGTAFLYSDRIPMPRFPDSSFLLGRKQGA